MFKNKSCLEVRVVMDLVDMRFPSSVIDEDVPITVLLSGCTTDVVLPSEDDEEQCLSRRSEEPALLLEAAAAAAAAAWAAAAADRRVVALASEAWTITTRFRVLIADACWLPLLLVGTPRM